MKIVESWYDVDLLYFAQFVFVAFIKIGHIKILYKVVGCL